MVAKKTAVKYGAGIGERIVGDLYDDVDQAKRQVTWAQEQGQMFGVDPADVRVVTVEETTTYGRPKVYREPVDEEPTVEETPVITDQDPAEKTGD